MIITIRPGGPFRIQKEGKELTISVPPSGILSHFGPIVEVLISQPKIIQDRLLQEGKGISPVKAKALIDTGASITAIRPKIADQLQLRQTGFQKMYSVQDEQDQPVYFGNILFPWGGSREIPIVACPLKTLDCLIGRDILQHWHLSYNGPDGSIVICD